MIDILFKLIEKQQMRGGKNEKCPELKNTFFKLVDNYLEIIDNPDEWIEK